MEATYSDQGRRTNPVDEPGKQAAGAIVKQKPCFPTTKKVRGNGMVDIGHRLARHLEHANLRIPTNVRHGVIRSPFPALSQPKH